MRFFDLHCDTLYRSLVENKELYKNDFHVDFNRAKNYNPYVGCFAVWIPDNVRGSDAINLFESALNRLCYQQKSNKDFFEICKSFDDIQALEKSSQQGIVLTVEGGAILAGNVDRVEYLAKMGVKILTLTWNGTCEIGDGADVLSAMGLSNFGYKVIQSMEKYGIIIDVSHASEKLFYDVAEIAKKPFIATHSNSNVVCPHRRNLTDEQFKIIANNNGLVGITFCNYFLSSEKLVNFNDIRNHIEHFLELDGENILAFGSDFDGADVPEAVKGIEYIEDLYEYFLIKNYKESLLDKIFFYNAYNFMSKNMR